MAAHLAGTQASTSAGLLTRPDLVVRFVIVLGLRIVWRQLVQEVAVGLVLSLQCTKTSGAGEHGRPLIGRRMGGVFKGAWQLSKAGGGRLSLHPGTQLDRVSPA